MTRPWQRAAKREVVIAGGSPTPNLHPARAPLGSPHERSPCVAADLEHYRKRPAVPDGRAPRRVRRAAAGTCG